VELYFLRGDDQLLPRGDDPPGDPPTHGGVPPPLPPRRGGAPGRRLRRRVRFRWWPFLVRCVSSGGLTPPPPPPRRGESLPHCPLAGAEPRDGACGAGCVYGGGRSWSALRHAVFRHAVGATTLGSGGRSSSSAV